ncbi:MAG: hypothetical protein HC836_04215 [Richelia sp. RM2_1_2]|nr:hypothetical protein [Richelia sp. SM1_7_0]NJN08283.1 hypothetical protein [Richelia sp. RM1_1_1]NJO26358.1 hypothetical protein [Richelia sp. SL_2_1]NJO57603.1 hypothetical protein [Richelia sp. RM2_1_2]
MFITLLLVTFLISFVVSAIVVRMFGKPIDKILRRIIADEISQAWVKYLKFAIYVVGISSGVKIWTLERYITPPQIERGQIIQLTTERWVLEVYGTIIGCLQGIAWLLLVFFVFALIAFVIVRIFELRRPMSEEKREPTHR